MPLKPAVDEAVAATPSPYSGPVAGLVQQYIYGGSDNVNITVTGDNWFLHAGPEDDAIAAIGGINVLDGGTGSNFLTGGTGSNTFFVDDRAAKSDIWSTVLHFNAGDAATLSGSRPADSMSPGLTGKAPPDSPASRCMRQRPVKRPRR